MKYLLIIAIFLSNCTLADDDYEYRYNKTGVKPVNNELYKSECGACHFAYQPGLLPANAWNKMMANLENHFNTDATIENSDFKIISDYLDKNSAEKAMNYKRSRKIVNSIKNADVPESISKTPYIIRKHDELKTSMITQDEVKGLFNCTACHTTAQKGIYSERAIKIPNYGRWDD